jgi:TonB family protein
MATDIVSQRLASVGAMTALALFAGCAPLHVDEANIDRNYPSPQPIYPRSAEARGAQGDVMLQVLIGASGRPRKIRLDGSSGNPALDNAAVEAAANWRYVPVFRDGETVSAWTSLRVRFQLHQTTKSPAPDPSGQWPQPAPAQKR